MFLLYNSLYFVFENFYHKSVLKNLLCPFFSWGFPRNRKVNLTSKSLPGCICLIFTLPVPVTLRHSWYPFKFGRTSVQWVFLMLAVTSGSLLSPRTPDHPLHRGHCLKMRCLILDWNQEDPDGSHHV